MFKNLSLELYGKSRSYGVHTAFLATGRHGQMTVEKQRALFDLICLIMNGAFTTTDKREAVDWAWVIGRDNYSMMCNGHADPCFSDTFM